MQPNAMIQTLKSLKLHGMAQAIEELASQASPAYQGAEGILDSLLKAEVAEREVRSVSYQVKVARFPTYRDLSGFDFSQSAVNEAQIRTLHKGLFVENAENVVLIGGPGTGKTHLATAIAVQAIMHMHRRVRFFSTAELVNALEMEKNAGKHGQIANRLGMVDLVILVAVLPNVWGICGCSNMPGSSSAPSVIETRAVPPPWWKSKSALAPATPGRPSSG